MIKELLLTKLKEYGESLIAKHGESDIGMVDKIIDGYVEKLEIEQTQFGEKVINLAGGTEQFFIIKFN